MFSNFLSAGDNITTTIVWIVVIVLMIVVLFVMPMLSNRKRQKEANEVLDSLAVGDEIMTIGGIMGRIVSLDTHESGEKLMTIETGDGANKTTMTFTVQALRLNYTKTKQRQEQLAKEKAAKAAAKNDKSHKDEVSPESEHDNVIEPENTIDQQDDDQK